MITEYPGHTGQKYSVISWKAVMPGVPGGGPPGPAGLRDHGRGGLGPPSASPGPGLGDGLVRLWRLCGLVRRRPLCGVALAAVEVRSEHGGQDDLSLIHISEPTRLGMIS